MVTPFPQPILLLQRKPECIMLQLLVQHARVQIPYSLISLVQSQFHSLVLTLFTAVDDPAAILIPSNTPGTFTGTGISGNTFDPAVAGIGIHTITYDYATNSGCLFTASQNTRVDACLHVSINQINNSGYFSKPKSGRILFVSTCKWREVGNDEYQRYDRKDIDD